MRRGGLIQTVVLVAVFAMMTTAAYSWAQTGPSVVRPAGVSWDPEALLVSYRDIWAEFADQDPTPLIRIFGDGRVLVHYPVYTPKAGEYELWLQSTELENLLMSLVAKGLVTFEPEAVENLKRSEERRRWEIALDANKLPELFKVADDSTSVFELHLTSYRPAGTAPTSGEIHRTISWTGLRTDAEIYPEIAPIQQLRAAELELRALIERDNLWRIH